MPTRVRFSESRIDRIFEELDQSQLPGAAVGIAVEGKPVYRKGFGLASIEAPMALSPTVRLRIGSTSKHFTCFAFLLLCEDGRASIDETIGTFIPELHASACDVSMRQLMTNTSGLRDAYDIVTQFEDHFGGHAGVAQSLVSADILSLYKCIDDINAPPGESWIYNNGGFLLLSTAIERIAGRPLEEVMRDRIFGPIGMNDTLLLRRDCDFIANRATQHVVKPGGGLAPWWDFAAQGSEGGDNAAQGALAFERMYWGMDNFVGAGAVVSTVDDMLRWLAHMGSPEVGSPETWTLMTRSGSLTNGTFTGYGFGLMVDHYRGLETIHHAGNALGGSSEMLKVPEVGLDVIVLINRQDVSGVSLLHRILDEMLFDGPSASEVPRRLLPSGVFHSPSTGRVVQLTPKGDVLVASVGGTQLPAIGDPEGRHWDLEFAWNDSKQRVTLLGDLLVPEKILLNDFGNLDEMLRVSDSESDGDESAIAGKYRYEGLGVDALIAVDARVPRLRTAGRFGSAEFDLQRLSRGIWRAKPAEQSRVAFIGGVLTFDDIGFKFSNLQTRPLLFRRLAGSMGSE